MSTLSKIHQILRFPGEIPLNFIEFQTLEAYLIFSSKSISNMKTFL
jgi:hypothetical protein